MKWFWRITAGVAAASLFVIALLFWSAWRASPFEPSANGAPLPSGIDTIAIQLDILSLIIGVVGIGLGVMSLIGYQAIRDAAVARADKVATEAMAIYLENMKRTGAGLESGREGGAPGAAEPQIVEELTGEENA